MHGVLSNPKNITNKITKAERKRERITLCASCGIQKDNRVSRGLGRSLTRQYSPCQPPQPVGSRRFHRATFALPEGLPRHNLSLNFDQSWQLMSLVLRVFTSEGSKLHREVKTKVFLNPILEFNSFDFLFNLDPRRKRLVCDS